MGSRGASSATANRRTKTKSQAELVAEQVDENLTAKFLDVINNNDVYRTYTAEEAVQNIIDLWAGSDYFAERILELKKDIASVKRVVNSKKASDSARERAQTELKASQDNLIINQWNYEAAKILEKG